MIVELDEMKTYLRVDYDDEDDLISDLLTASEKRCRDIARLDSDSISEHADLMKLAVLYSTAYLYDHRETADYNELNLNLRAMLFDIREAMF